MKRLLLPVTALFVLQACATSYDKGLEEAERMISAGGLEEAYERLKPLCAEKPGEKACRRLDEVKGLLRDRLNERVASAMKGGRVDGVLPLPVIEGLEKEAARLAEWGFGKEADGLSEKLAAERKAAIERVTAVKAEARRLLAEGKRVEAVEKAATAARIDPAAGAFLEQLRAEAAAGLEAEGDRAAADEDWRTALARYREVEKVAPGREGLAGKLADAEKRDNLAYYVNAAAEAVGKNDFARALKLYAYAATYPGSEDVGALVLAAKEKGVRTLIGEGLELISLGRSYRAYLKFKEGFAYLKDLPLARRTSIEFDAAAITRFLDEQFLRAAGESEKGRVGLAYQYMRTVVDIDPNYAGGRDRMKALREKLEQRAIKGLAVMPFRSPGYSPEAGKIFSSNITLYLYRRLSPDVRVVEREAIESLLKEYEVKLAGQMNEKARESFLQISGADYLVIGDVLDYKVESGHHETTKTVRVKTGVKKVRNPEHLDWEKKKKAGELDAEAVEPPKYLEEPVFEDITYKVVFFKKVGLVSVGYRVVDTKGKLLHTSVVEMKEEATGESTDGVEVGDFKVPLKVAELPSDTELIRKVQEKAIARIGMELKELLASPEVRYLAEAERHEKAGDLKEAIERLSDAQIVYEKKGLDTAPIEERIAAIMDLL
ncbi:MAG TPA: hypothetical protein ENJ37_03495 [Deltaproteobacteria bacterium]|nr:hypothetical protein [Deltaproteobacteria bacterium]